jgi:hypothetical protein
VRPFLPRDIRISYPTERTEGISSGSIQTTNRCPKWSARINKWVKVLPTGQPKRTAEVGPTHSRPICGREMRSGGQRPRWLAVRACPCLVRKSVNQKILATAALHKKLPAIISLQATATLPYPYTSSPRRRPRPAVAYSRSSPQPRSTVLEPSSPAWRAR